MTAYAERTPQEDAPSAHPPQKSTLHLVERLNGTELPALRPSSIEGVQTLLAEPIPQLIWRAGSDGVIDYICAQWDAFTDTRQLQPSPLHHGWESIIHADDAENFLERWAESVESGGLFEAECRIHREGDDYRWHLCCAVAVRDDTDQILGWFGTSTDIDDERRKRNGTALTRRATDQFLAIVAHELQTPLAPALLILAELEADPELSMQVVKSILLLRRNIEREAQRVGDLVDARDLLHRKLADCPSSIGRPQASSLTRGRAGIPQG